VFSKYVSLAYGCKHVHVGHMCISFVSFRSLIYCSVGLAFLWHTRRWSMYWLLTAALVGGIRMISQNRHFNIVFPVLDYLFESFTVRFGWLGMHMQTAIA
jgi:hypothetical protein